MAKGVELAGVGDGGFAGGIAVRVVEFCGPPDAGALFDNDINLALPATSERAVDDIFPRDGAARREVEAFNLAGSVHGRGS